MISKSLALFLSVVGASALGSTVQRKEITSNVLDSPYYPLIASIASSAVETNHILKEMMLDSNSTDVSAIQMAQNAARSVENLQDPLHRLIKILGNAPYGRVGDKTVAYDLLAVTKAISGLIDNLELTLTPLKQRVGVEKFASVEHSVLETRDLLQEAIHGFPVSSFGPARFPPLSGDRKPLHVPEGRIALGESPSATPASAWRQNPIFEDFFMNFMHPRMEAVYNLQGQVADLKALAELDAFKEDPQLRPAAYIATRPAFENILSKLDQLAAEVALVKRETHEHASRVAFAFAAANSLVVDPVMEAGPLLTEQQRSAKKFRQAVPFICDALKLKRGSGEGFICPLEAIAQVGDSLGGEAEVRAKLVQAEKVALGLATPEDFLTSPLSAMPSKGDLQFRQANEDSKEMTIVDGEEEEEVEVEVDEITHLLSMPAEVAVGVSLELHRVLDACDKMQAAIDNVAKNLVDADDLLYEGVEQLEEGEKEEKEEEVGSEKSEEAEKESGTDDTVVVEQKFKRGFIVPHLDDPQDDTDDLVGGMMHLSFRQTEYKTEASFLQTDNEDQEEDEEEEETQEEEEEEDDTGAVGFSETDEELPPSFRQPADVGEEVAPFDLDDIQFGTPHYTAAGKEMSVDDWLEASNPAKYDLEHELASLPEKETQPVPIGTSSLSPPPSASALRAARAELFRQGSTTQAVIKPTTNFSNEDDNDNNKDDEEDNKTTTTTTIDDLKATAAAQNEDSSSDDDAVAPTRVSAMSPADPDADPYTLEQLLAMGESAEAVNAAGDALVLAAPSEKVSSKDGDEEAEMTADELFASNVLASLRSMRDYLVTTLRAQTRNEAQPAIVDVQSMLEDVVKVITADDKAGQPLLGPEVAAKAVKLIEEVFFLNKKVLEIEIGRLQAEQIKQAMKIQDINKGEDGVSAKVISPPKNSARRLRSAMGRI